MKSSSRILLALLVALTSTPAMARDHCTRMEDDCFFGAGYDPFNDRTGWFVTCADGFEAGGVLPGNQVGALCD